MAKVLKPMTANARLRGGDMHQCSNRRKGKIIAKFINLVMYSR